MQRLTDRMAPFVKPIRAACAALAIAASHDAVAQETLGAADEAPLGIRYVLYLSLKADPDARLLRRVPGEPLTSTMTVKLRISAHSQETNFYGDVPATVSGFDPVEGSQPREVWRDAMCHHERGFPKISVINVDGSIKSRQTTISVSARYRWLGLLLPGDEIMQAKRIDAGADDIGPFTVTRTETKRSRIFVDLRLYTLSCVLPAVNPPADSKKPSE